MLNIKINIIGLPIETWYKQCKNLYNGLAVEAKRETWLAVYEWMILNKIHQVNDESSLFCIQKSLCMLFPAHIIGTHFLKFTSSVVNYDNKYYSDYNR